MNDVVLEWIIPYVMPAKKRLLKAVLVSLLIVLLADAVLFYAFLLLPAIVLGIVEFSCSGAGSWNMNMCM